MSRLTRWKEPLKTALIVLLAASALLLALRTGLFSELYRRGGDVQETPIPGGESLSIQPAAWPRVAAVTSAAGLRHGVAYDGAALAALYEGFSAYLGEALGSAQGPLLVSDKTWRQALNSQSLYLDYDCAPGLDVLAAWLGTEADWGADYRARRLLLAGGDDGSAVLYFMDDDGRAWQLQTEASWAAVRLKLEGYLPNGAEFAYHYPKLKDCAPYSLILAELPVAATLRASGRQDAAAAALAARFGVSLSGTNSYPEADGTVVYLGDQGNLRLEPGGAVRYTAGEGQGLPAGTQAAARIELGRGLLDALCAVCGGEAQLLYQGLRQEGERELVLFDYMVGGIPVSVEGGCAAWAAFQNGLLTELWLLPRAYTANGAAEHLFPNLQAAAAAGSRRKGSQAALVYQDVGDGTLTPFWAVED